MKLAPLLLSGLVVLTPLAAASADWPAWRGPTRDGHAATGQSVPIKWSETENVRWRAAVRGKGHASPTVVGDRVFLASADAATSEQLVLAFDRATGKTLWQTVVHRGPLELGNHKNSSAASASVVSDGERLFINFCHAKAVHTTALDPASGEILWQTRVADYQMHQGFGASPVVHENVMLVAADNRAGGRLAGLDRATGKILWSQERPKIANYASPAVFVSGGRTQAVLAGCGLVASFDPLTGKKLWETEGSTEETVVTAASDGQRVFISGGYPRSHVAALALDGSAKVLWQTPTRLYVPTLLVRDGHLFGVLDSGAAFCWRADTGDEVWREKVDKDYYASPIMVGDRIYATSLRGVTSVFEATAKHFKLLAQNQLGDEALASPSICGGQIFLRHAKKGEPRQEFLWCVAEK
ncbi:MAG: PQQ-binding-like beta-propeller repeat protein [Verrucomicrobia bacterium]|nr:PQQ-binding-like beta-propeller repeat protein [Verrucomicrobiota bacterium]